MSIEDQTYVQMTRREFLGWAAGAAAGAAVPQMGWAMERWMINGRSYPDVPEPVLTEGRRYRLRMLNKSMDDHPMHMHRHTFELREIPRAKSGTATIRTRGIMKDTVLVRVGAATVVEVVADNLGKTLFHCHQQNHIDLGFMMLFRYA